MVNRKDPNYSPIKEATERREDKKTRLQHMVRFSVRLQHRYIFAFRGSLGARLGTYTPTLRSSSKKQYVFGDEAALSMC